MIRVKGKDKDRVVHLIKRVLVKEEVLIHPEEIRVVIKEILEAMRGIKGRVRVGVRDRAKGKDLVKVKVEINHNKAHLINHNKVRKDTIRSNLHHPKAKLLPLLNHYQKTRLKIVLRTLWKNILIFGMEPKLLCQ
jgi:hypothetical protein